MSERIHALAQLLLGKSTIEECSVEEIQQLTKQYPYFSPAQFLSLQKLKESNSPDWEAQQQKTVLYYHDPIQFDYFVSSDKFYIDESILTIKPVITPEPAAIKESVETIAAENIAAGEHDQLTKPVTEAGEPDYAPSVRTKSDDQQPLNAEPIAENRNPAEQVDVQETVALPELSSPVEKSEETKHEAVAEEIPASEDADLNDAAFTEKAVPATPDEEPAVEVGYEKTSPVANLTSATTKNSVLATPAPKAGGEALSFEPYHTVDYFASQGIKITAEDLPKDKLGKQLRSFTEWLKMMKRLPASEISKAPESSAEKNVEYMASHSVAESDVVTEAMAEVWAKQGAREKAIETYNKLSLLNPSKRAYFAAKIEILKQS